LVASVVACLLLNQALALVFSRAHHSDDFGAFISSTATISNELCADKSGGDGRAPQVQQHCLACLLSEQSADPDSSLLSSVVVLVLTPRSDDPTHWIEQRDLAPPAAQWPSNRLSRAPPSLLS